MKFDILTLFPGMFDAVLGESIIGRARDKGIIQINAVDIRSFSTNKHRKVDDYPFGGGTGMVMGVQPIYDAYLSLTKELNYKPRVIYMSPQGKVLDQKLAQSLKESEHLILLCGHYEGVDERIIEEIVDEEISIGDYVLTGGEIPAMVIIDCVSRLCEGVLPSSEAYESESHYNGLLEYPQYTRPSEFKGKKVPEILLSGHHANIEKWRKKQSIKRTYQKRPDLFSKLRLSQSEEKLLKEALEEDE